MLTTLFCSLATPVLAAPDDSPYVINNLVINDYNLGTKRYLEYIEDETGHIKSTSIWQRTTHTIEKEGEMFIAIDQVWRSTNENSNRQLESLNRIADFSPVYQKAVNSQNVVEAFNFDEQHITGDKSVADNVKAEFSIASQADTLNWELDIETFSLLNYSADKVFKLNFYHPGSKSAPKYYLYTVVGSEVLTTSNFGDVDCWLLKIDYALGSHATFWIDKNTRQMMKMQEVWGKNNRYKILLPL